MITAAADMKTFNSQGCSKEAIFSYGYHFAVWKLPWCFVLTELREVMVT